MNTQPQIIRVPPPALPPTRNRSGFFEPDETRLPMSFWSEVLGELRRVRWLDAREVAARTVVTIALLVLLALFGSGCGALAQAMLGA